MKHALLLPVLAGWLARAVSAGTTPDTGTADAFFGLTNLYTFHLTIAPDQWAIMQRPDQPQGNGFRPPGNNFGPGGFAPGPAPGGGGPPMAAEFKHGAAALEFEGQPWGTLRVRFKGNSSYRFAQNSLKRSLKLDFGETGKGRAFFGLTKLNLNNNAMDPSQLREALAYHVFRDSGLPAGRTAFARVFLTVPGKYDRTFAGLYTVVEQVDARYLKTHCGAKGGLLLKPEHLPGLPYFGDDWGAYTNQVEVKTAVTASESRRFIDLVKCINLADDARFQASVGDYLEADQFLRFLALEGLLANMDSPLMTGHNYYLYLHPQTRKFLWLPWDLNEAFGGFFPAGNAREQSDLSVDHPFTSVNRLAERLLQSPGMKDRYHQIVRGLLATNFNAARLFPVVDALAATIRSAVAEDQMLSLPQFEAALATTNAPDAGNPAGAGGGNFRRGGPRGPKPALKAFIDQRVASAKLQLEGKSTGYVPREMRPGPNGPMPFGPRPEPPR
jgi:spore coat protein H